MNIVAQHGETLAQYCGICRPIQFFGSYTSGRFIQDNQMLLHREGKPGRNYRRQESYPLDTEHGGNFQTGSYSFREEFGKLSPNVYLENQRDTEGGSQ